VQRLLPFDGILEPAPGTLERPAGTVEHPRTIDVPPGSVDLSPTRVLFVRHPRARRYVIHVRPDGAVRITIPRRGSKREAEALLTKQGAWIRKHLEKVAARRTAPRPQRPPEVVRELRARAARELPARLAALAERHGVVVARVSIRNQRWRWGSCSRAGRICLNWRLVTMPQWVSDYVMIHELMHLKRMDHSPKFWKLVAAACPDYQEARAWLREHGIQ
jgi:predicted metal-dependent hydrolase